jgi:hypothetical protein
MFDVNTTIGKPRRYSNRQLQHRRRYKNFLYKKTIIVAVVNHFIFKIYSRVAHQFKQRFFLAAFTA